jgi:POT family proton-dependent oligopeptide transporter
MPPQYGPEGPRATEQTFFGHPRGLATLFFTEMWERFSYYGMRALLVLFMTAPLAVANAGLGFGAAKSAAIYGLYTSFVYLLALPGGWVADNLWGQRRAVFVGGCIIAAGHFSMAGPLVGAPDLPSFFIGLLLIVIGTGLLKPNVSTMVGDLYPSAETTSSDPEAHMRAEKWGAMRDAGFSIFYMGINLGAILGPFICGTLGEKVNWHWGFSAAGFGMILGLIQYKRGDKYLGKVGYLDTDDSADELSRKNRAFYLVAGVIATVAALFAILSLRGTIDISLEGFATWMGYGILLLTILFFSYLILGIRWAVGLLVVFAGLVAFLLPRFEPTIAGRYAIAVTLGLFILLNVVFLATGGEKVTVTRKRLMVIFWLFLLAAVFWSGFEQAGSSMNLFARDLTDRTYFGWEMPTTWLQNVNPLFIVIFAPIFGYMWTWLAQRDANPSIPMKFALGLLGLSAGFFVIAWGAAQATLENPVTPAWLIVTYFLHTCGELALSPVGLSSMTKLAPTGRVGQMMGVWFIAAALGNLIAGLVAGQLETLPPDLLFRTVALIAGGAGVIALLFSRPVKKLMVGVE